MSAVLLRRVEVDGGTGLDVRLQGGVVAEIGQGLSTAGALVVDGADGALIPGLCDHHIHLLAAAAQLRSVDLSQVRTPAQLRDAIEAAAAATPVGAWIRAVGYHDGVAGDLDRTELDALAPRHRLRMQHRTGALWSLNTAALASVDAASGPPTVERGADGRPTGRLWRGDAWLRTRIEDDPPPLAAIGRRLAACGVTAVTDASATTDASALALLAGAHRRGDLPQRLTLMSAGPLCAPTDGAVAVGPVKLLLDDHALPPFEDALARLADARAWGRALAVHAVTAGELAFTLALFAAGGARRGDRIEHGGVIPPDAIAAIRELDLTVVTQSAFVAERGDRYLAEVAAEDVSDLYRCASLMAAGVPVVGSSDAPYTDLDPWAGVAAAMTRRTRDGHLVGRAERLDGEAALGLYLGCPDAPGRSRRRVAVGAPADLCLLDAPLAEALRAPSADHVRATFIKGAVVHMRT